MSDRTTRDVQIRVQVRYVPERSDPARHQFFFAYQVTITNHGPATVQLVSRHWIITDAFGRVDEVKGDGVVGEQPVLATGESFTYTSACPLATSTGSMRGTYQMVTADGARFDAEIAPFHFVTPQALN